MADSKPNSDSILHVYHTRYSSWGARVTLVLAHFGIPHNVKFYAIDDPARAPPAHFAGGGLLPVLQPDPSDEDYTIADSLSICEFLAEMYPELHLWPKDVKLRALARTAAAQMHSGFAGIRNSYPSNFFGKYTGEIPVSGAAAKEIRWLVDMWSNARADTKKILQELGEEDEDEGYLFGTFSIADAFFWPVLWRFRSYQLPLTGISEDGLKWMATMWNDPVMRLEAKEYSRQAQDPSTELAKYEDIYRGNSDVEYGRFSMDWTFDATHA
ncbi:hypothetical protein GGR54DRAFT_643411 [Hypoxylon sp. NC1633]|nr:hypothetical protein GGR54DRAFT_643411 [Hypoxylon sp. NC1633]